MGWAVGDARARRADQLYANREDLPSAERAAMLWEEHLDGNPRDFEAAWKLSRTRYWLGGHVGEDERRDQYEQGIAVARRASLMERDSPEGHFWMAANMGALAAPLDPEWAPEDREFKAKAQALLETIQP